jgi:hypothetical protein
MRALLRERRAGSLQAERRRLAVRMKRQVSGRRERQQILNVIRDL